MPLAGPFNVLAPMSVPMCPSVLGNKSMIAGLAALLGQIIHSAEGLSVCLVELWGPGSEQSAGHTLTARSTFGGPLPAVQDWTQQSWGRRLQKLNKLIVDGPSR